MIEKDGHVYMTPEEMDQWLQRLKRPDRRLVWALPLSALAGIAAAQVVKWLLM